MDLDATANPERLIDEEGDWIVRQFVSPADLRLKPEEYVARHAHDLGGFSFQYFQFADPVLGAWVRRVGELLASEEEVNRCREFWLSPDELTRAGRLDTEAL